MLNREALHTIVERVSTLWDYSLRFLLIFRCLLSLSWVHSVVANPFFLISFFAICVLRIVLHLSRDRL